jgi:filamentous hemagglutinin family protein
MNHIYRSIWSPALGTWVAVSETSKSKGKGSSTRRKLLVTGLLLCSSTSWALPTDGQVVAGQVGINTPAAGQMQIDQSSQKAIVNWQGFSIAPTESVNINQPNAQATMLNRVVGQDASQIQGQLHANGQVYLVNPNGVVFGKTAQVDVGGLVATTHNITDQDFLNGKNHFTQDGAKGTVENHGTIKTPEGGVVALIGETVTNTGTINTPKGTTALAAGKTVDLDFQGDGLVEVKVSEAALKAQVDNKGAILADGGRVVLTAKAAGQLVDTVINQEGIVRAQGLVERNGEIILDGGNAGVTQVSGTLDASSTQTGGKINVTGNQVQIQNTAKLDASGDAGGGAIVVGDKLATSQTTIQQDATVKAQSRDHGNAGKIEVLANMDSGVVNVDGKLDASALNNGDGGFVDTSAAHVKVADTAKISTKAANGKTGTWIIDPTDFTIAASGGDITGAALSTNLVSTGVTIYSTSGASGANGDVNVNDAVTWSANQLTLNAQNNININANLNASGTGKLALQYGQSSATGGTSDYFINNGAKVILPAGANFSTQKGTNGGANIINYTVVTTAPTLQSMAVATNYALGGDIDVGSIANFVPVGTSASNFTGKFAGLGHTISNLTINRTANNATSDYQGLFGYTSTTSIIRDVGLVAANIVGRNFVGGLVGRNNGTTSNAYVTGTVRGADVVGGLVGYNGGNISNVYSTANVTVTTANNHGGGLVGENQGAIANAYATGNVSSTASAYLGGLVGRQNNAAATITNAYATGLVNGSNAGREGGLVGRQSAGTTTNSFWNTTTSGQTNGVGGGALAGATGKTTAQMMQAGTFAAWDISSTGGSSAVWRIYEGHTSPLLRSFLTTYTLAGAPDVSLTYNGGTQTAGSFTNIAGILGSAASGKNVGVYNGYYSTQQGYDLIGGNLTITPASLTYTANAATRTYGAANPAFSGTIIGLLGTDTLAGTTTGTASFTSTATNASNVGSYAITGTGVTLTSANYILSQAATNATALSITPATLTYTANAASRLYGAANPAFSGTITGFVNGESQTTATTGTLSFSSLATALSNVGNYLVSGAGLTANNGNYNFVQAAANNSALSVTPATLTYTANAASRLYGAANPAFSGTITGFVNGESQATATTGTLSFSSLANALSNVGNYLVSGAGLTANNGNYNFVQAAANNSALSVTPATLTYTANAASRLYGAANPAFSGTITGFVNGESQSTATTGTLSFSSLATALSNVGNYLVSGAGLTANNGNYNFVQAAANNTALSVTPATLTYTANAASRLYGAANPAFSGTITGFVNGESQSTATTGTLSFSSLATALSNVGNYLVSGAGLTANNGNYNFVQAAANNSALSVTPATLTYTANAASRLYGAANPAFSGTITGFVNGESQSTATTGTLSFSSLATALSNVGNYLVSGAGLTANNGNYNFVQAAANNTALSVTPATLTYTANAASRLYGAANPAFSGTITGFVNGETQATATTGTLSFSSLANALSNVGNYLVSGAGLTANNGNYNFVQAAANNTALSITPATLTYTANAASRLYGAANPAFSGTITGFVNGETQAAATTGTLSFSSLATALSNVGNYLVSGAGLTANNGNYNFVQAAGNNSALNITPAALTITANDATKIYGQTLNFAGTEFISSGLLNSETIGTVDLTSTGAAATAHVAATPYTITAANATGGTFQASNYNISYANGGLTVSPALLSITANDLSKTYGQTYTFTGTEFVSSGLQNADVIDTVALTSTGAAASANLANKPYAITATNATGSAFQTGDYNITYVDGGLTVNPAALILTANDVIKIYDGTTNAVSTAKVFNGTLFNNDSLSGGSFAFADKNAGTNKMVTVNNVTVNDGNNGQNYTVSYQNNTNSIINKAGLIITANADSKVYNGLAYFGGNGVSYSGFVNGENNLVLTGNLGYAGSSQGATEVGNYLITPQGLNSSNYTIGYINGNLIISARPVIPSVNTNNINGGSVVTEKSVPANINANTDSDITEKAVLPGVNANTETGTDNFVDSNKSSVGKFAQQLLLQQFTPLQVATTFTEANNESYRFTEQYNQGYNYSDKKKDKYNPFHQSFVWIEIENGGMNLPEQM